MTEARAWDLYTDPMPDQPSLDGYVAKTEAIPFELALRILGVAPGRAAQLAAPAGQIYGRTRLLAHLPAFLAAGRLPVPAALLAAHDLTPDALFAGTTTPAVQKLVAAMTHDIAAQLAALQPQISALSKPQRVAMLPLATVALYLKQISHTHRDPLRDIADLAPLARVWRITMAHVTGRFQARPFHADT
jgi:15-cis-phytoene synthase